MVPPESWSSAFQNTAAEECSIVRPFSRREGSQFSLGEHLLAVAIYGNQVIEDAGIECLPGRRDGIFLRTRKTKQSVNETEIVPEERLVCRLGIWMITRGREKGTSASQEACTI